MYQYIYVSVHFCELKRECEEIHKRLIKKKKWEENKGKSEGYEKIGEKLKNE